MVNVKQSGNEGVWYNASHGSLRFSVLAKPVNCLHSKYYVFEKHLFLKTRLVLFLFQSAQKHAVRIF